MLTQPQLDAINAEVLAGLQGAATVAGTVDPAILPAVLLGNAIAKLEPTLFDGVVNLIKGNEPTAADEAALDAAATQLQTPSQI